jgi:general secretion pathway protein G
MKHKRLPGFTLIEIAIVVSIIAIIASITIIAFTQVQQESRDRERAADTSSLKAALANYFAANNEYPAVCSSGDNYACNVSFLSTPLVPDYIPTIPVDPKGSSNAYSYVRGTNSAGYGILVKYEGQAACKAGVNVSIGWWGSSVPICSDN